MTPTFTLTLPVVPGIITCRGFELGKTCGEEENACGGLLERPTRWRERSIKWQRVAGTRSAENRDKWQMIVNTAVRLQNP